MTCRLFSQVVLLGGQTEVKGRGDDSGKILAGCWWSRQNLQGTKSCRFQCKAKYITAVGYNLKACWDFRESLRRYKLALCFFLLYILVKESNFLFIIWFESGTQVSIANQPHAGQQYQLLSFFASLFLSTQASGTFRSYCISNYSGNKKQRCQVYPSLR